MLVTLAGGVGAARFLDGLVQVVDPRIVTVIVNTGDDVERFGLTVSPDVDIVLYTLAGLVDQVRGWGLAGDTTFCLEALGGLGAPTWFRLGDRDLATHLVRTTLLREGKTPTEVTRYLAEKLGVRANVLPMTDQSVRTIVATDEGELAFQTYFVERGQQDEVRGIRVAGADQAFPAPGAIDAILTAEAVLIAPSNPFVSIGTILSVPGYRTAIAETKAPVAAISPIVGGQALKGPADKMLRSLGHESTALGVAKMYRDFVDVFILDTLDAALAPLVIDLGMKAVVTDTIMSGSFERAALARAVLKAVR